MVKGMARSNSHKICAAPTAGRQRATFGGGPRTRADALSAAASDTISALRGTMSIQASEVI